jgi:hypothetical protein
MVRVEWLPHLAFGGCLSAFSTVGVVTLYLYWAGEPVFNSNGSMRISAGVGVRLKLNLRVSTWLSASTYRGRGCSYRPVRSELCKVTVHFLMCALPTAGRAA